MIRLKVAPEAVEYRKIAPEPRNSGLQAKDLGQALKKRLYVEGRRGCYQRTKTEPKDISSPIFWHRL